MLWTVSPSNITASNGSLLKDLIRYDKKPGNSLGLIQLACTLLWYRRLLRAREVQAF